MAVKEQKTKKAQAKTRRESDKKNIKSEEKKLRIELIRSVIGHPRYQREVVKGIGLRKINSFIIRKDSPEIWGMINKIPHLLKVEKMEKK